MALGAATEHLCCTLYKHKLHGLSWDRKLTKVLHLIFTAAYEQWSERIRDGLDSDVQVDDDDAEEDANLEGKHNSVVPDTQDLAGANSSAILDQCDIVAVDENQQSEYNARKKMAEAGTYEFSHLNKKKSAHLDKDQEHDAQNILRLKEINELRRKARKLERAELQDAASYADSFSEYEQCEKAFCRVVHQLMKKMKSSNDRTVDWNAALRDELRSAIEDGSIARDNLFVQPTFEFDPNADVTLS